MWQKAQIKSVLNNTFADPFMCMLWEHCRQHFKVDPLPVPEVNVAWANGGKHLHIKLRRINNNS